MRTIRIIVGTVYSFILDEEIIKLVRKEFGVQVDNFHRTKAHIERGWDGMIYPITDKGCFQTGMLPLFTRRFKELGCAVMGEDSRSNDLEPVAVNLSFLRDYQRNVVLKAVNNHLGELPFYRGIINGATNAGKTYITLGIWESFSRAPLIFLVHRKKLFKQQVDFFTEQLGEENVGQLNDKITDIEKPFVIAMYSSAGNVRLDRFKIVIVDEAHMIKGTKYTRLVKKIKNADVRFCLSGTALKVSKLDQYDVIGSSGDVISKISNEDLIEGGHSARPIIFMQKIHNEGYFYNWRKVYKDLIVYNRERNEAIQEFVVKHRKTRQTWVVCRAVAHAELLAEMCSAELLTGKTPKREGDEIIQGFIEGGYSCVVSTMVIDVGMNLPIEAFVVALGGKSEIDVLQLIGRALRKTKFDDVYVLDFFDTGRYVEDHSTERLRIYKEEKFNVEILK